MGTAGSATKRSLVRTFGVISVSSISVSSRDTRYAEGIAPASSGCFAGGVLNSLASSGFLAATMASLDLHARFVEIAHPYTSRPIGGP